MTGWDSTDLRALRRVGAGLGSFQVISIEENGMTEQTPENEGQAPWDAEDQPQNWDGSPVAAPAASFPEHPYKLADHVYTWSPKLPDGSMLVIRAQSAKELAEKAEALVAVSGRLKAAWGQVAGGGAPAPQMPAQAGPMGMPQIPTGPPFGPNVSVPAAPGYVGPPAPQMPQQQGWGGAPQAPQQQWNNGGGQQQGGRKPYPAPQGWYRLNVPYPKGTDQLHALAQQYGIPKGNPDKNGKYNFWGLTPSGQPGKAWYCAPEVAQAFQQFNPVVG